MKLFILKAIIFFLIPITGYLLVGSLLKIKAIQNIENSQVIILGDSQTKFIRSPKLFNHSVDGSPYFVQYEFVKKYINQIKGKKVYISCNYHNLSTLYQNRLANESLLPGWRAKIFEELDKYDLINYKNAEVRPNDLNYNFFDIKKPLKNFKLLFVSKPQKNQKTTVINDTLNIINKSIYAHWKDKNYILEDSIQRKFLDRTISFLKENKCEVILLKMPLTNYYLDNVPKNIKDELNNFPDQYNIRLLNLNDTLLISKNYHLFKDYGHLNVKGDSMIANYLNETEF